MPIAAGSSGLLKRAVAGEEIVVIIGDSIAVLRPVSVQATDTMATEYGLTKEEADRAARRIHENAKRGPWISLDELQRRVADRNKARRRGRNRKAARVGASGNLGGAPRAPGDIRAAACAFRPGHPPIAAGFV
jgi:hypothetical protein